MNSLKLISEGNGFGIASVENFQNFAGKAFVKDILGTTGMEISFGTLGEGEAVPFLHKHKQNEEVYIILRGEGIFSLDGNDYPVKAGDVIRVEPEVSRGNRNTGSEPLTYVCIQAKAGSLEQYTMTDGVILA